ncbi:bifunctional 3-phosphoshikimate 1-carboxyvinyltransferase/cytidylate kinase [Paucibacter sp. APW11]|uniref:Multifunctional fusion protein n=1 Tax=Roseateles aquae TaxID=3077235 RepID=A0ABU3P677_9BURK|nr:bifunctional 3-phosphoshikimate 1-carboxyvinyltransferase/cytidylate kinase [Paucibacter sp. APW11]MDT8998071.1 bifunctional 3-phosphoshikimate 1-carboxyvinyltransferase/cytidylate kinase [Paucibacter sp. APW11]
MFKIPFLDIPPLQRAAGTVRLPGSKSISNRVLLLAGLSEGQTAVHDLLDSDDTRVMLASLRELGCQLEQREDGVLLVTGIGAQLKGSCAKLFLGNAGTAMRPLTAALALLAATQGGEFELSGVPRMHERPIGDLVDALRALGCQIECLGNEGYPPLRLSGPSALKLNEPVRVRGDVSSQFLTALLLALPLVSAQPVVVEVVGELISKPYVHITLELLARFGIQVQREGWQRFTIPAGSRYRSPGAVHVEGDASSASYFIALGALAAIEQPLRIEGVGSASLQGDVRFAEAASAMGARIEAGPNWLAVQRGAWPLKAIDLDCNHIPDAAMTLAVMALYADGPSTLRNIASWRVKETDRIAAMATELKKLGAQVEEGPDWLRVHPLRLWQSASIHTYDDHRVAMCFSLAAFHGLLGKELVGPRVTVRIEDPNCVAKTFPDYFETLFEVVSADPADVPVITIDGPTASGKGTLADEVAHELGYWILDSGALYRATGLAASRAGIDLDDAQAVAAVARGLDLHFRKGRATLAGEDVTEALRAEATGLMASQVAAHQPVRDALQQLQLDFRRAPGLVADGRDMGTAIFPDAGLKVFLTASAATRAERRHKQLISKGISASIEGLRADLEARDARDKSRSASPLKPAADALSLDNSAQTIEESRDLLLRWWAERGPFSVQR